MRWLKARERELLPTRYVHAVFTLPHELAPLVLQNKRILYNLLFHASAETLLEIARDGVETRGEIVGKYCRNHGEMSYSFTVNEKKFYGSGFCPVSCDQAAIGSPISVTYARRNPTNSRCDTAEQAESRPGNNYTMLIILAVALTVIIFRITRVNAKQA